jgi:hypothetical protein
MRETQKFFQVPQLPSIRDPMRETPRYFSKSHLPERLPYEGDAEIFLNLKSWCRFSVTVFGVAFLRIFTGITQTKKHVMPKHEST